MKSRMIGLALISTLVASTGSIAGAEELNAANLANRIESARTAADHEQLATYFEAQSATAATEAQRHVRMKQSYRQFYGKAHDMKSHCEGLIKTYRTAADEYAALAKLHHDLAKEAK